MKDKLLAEHAAIKMVLRTGTDGRTHAVIKAPLGGMIIPYFLNLRRDKIKIVLIRQYRLPLRKKTLESAGGRFDGQTAKEALRRELEEETGIKVNAENINIVVEEYLHPPLFGVIFTGGIVEINAQMIKKNKVAGNEKEQEHTQVKVLDLVKVLKAREVGKIKFDLMTSRLMDEVAKVTGLLVKKY